MDNVIDLKSRRDNRPTEAEADLSYEETVSGPAKCLACGHEWMVSRMAAGDSLFDIACPRCDTRRGQLMYPVDLPTGCLTWVHTCGSAHFTPVLVSKAGKMLTQMDVKPENAEKFKQSRLVLMCHGCGDFVPVEDML